MKVVLKVGPPYEPYETRRRLDLPLPPVLQQELAKSFGQGRLRFFVKTTGGYEEQPADSPALHPHNYAFWNSITVQDSDSPLAELWGATRAHRWDYLKTQEARTNPIVVRMVEGLLAQGSPWNGIYCRGCVCDRRGQRLAVDAQEAKTNLTRPV